MLGEMGMHGHTKWCFWIGGAALVAFPIAGCRHRPPATSGASPAEPPATRGRPRAGGEVHRESAGPIHLGMAASEVKKLPNLTVRPIKVKQQGHPVEALQLSQFGLPIAVAELNRGHVVKVRIFSEKYRTPEGAGIGTSVKQLEKLYGPGRLRVGDGAVEADFARAAGVRFCFRPVKPLLALKTGDWAGLRRLNPGVQWIILNRAPSGGA